MKKLLSVITSLFLAGVIVFSFSGCNKVKTDGREVEIPDFNYEVSGKTELVVSDIESGSAMLTIGEKDNAASYLYEVSKYNNFDKAVTKEIRSENREKRIWFDDNSKLYVRATAIASNGKCYGVSDVSEIAANSVEIIAQDDFRKGGDITWTLEGCRAKSDFHSAVIQSTTMATDLSLMKKTFTVDMSAAEIFEIRFQTKNTMSSISVKLNIAGNTVDVVKNMEVLSEGYIRKNLNGLNLSGSQQVEVVIESKGLYKGFQLDYVRFIKENAYIENKAFMDNTFVNEFNTYTVNTSGISIINDAEPTVTALPSVDVNFSPLDLPILEIGMAEYRAIDTITISIKDINGTVKASMGPVNIQNAGGKLSYNLFNDYGITEEGQYNFSYQVSNDRVEVTKMQLIGEGANQVAVTKDNNWNDGPSAFINNLNEIRLKQGVIYNYGDINKVISVDMSNNPIVFFNVTAVSGSWAVKVIPEGATSDIRLTPDSKKTGKTAFDLRSVISEEGTTNVKFIIFIIGANAGDQTCYLKMDPIRFGNSMSIIPEKTDKVVSKMTYSVNDLSIDDTGFITVDIVSLSEGSLWKLYIIDNGTNRTYELKTALERKFPARYFRTKTGKYVYDINEITKMTGTVNITIKLVIIGDSATATVRDITITNNNNIPVTII